MLFLFGLFCAILALIVYGIVGAARIVQFYLLLWDFTLRKLGRHGRLAKKLERQALETFKVNFYDDDYDVMADLVGKAKTERWTAARQHEVYTDLMFEVMKYRERFPKANERLFVKFIWWYLHKDEYATSQHAGLGKSTSDPVQHYYKLIKWSNEHNGKMPAGNMMKDKWTRKPPSDHTRRWANTGWHQR